MSAESLRMVLSLEVDETLHTNYTLYQSEATTSISFPSHIRMFPWNDIQQLCQYIYQQTQILCIHQRLFFRGREITAYRKRRKKKKNCNKTAPSLSFFGITDGATIYLQCAAPSSSSPIVFYGNNNKNGDRSLIKLCVDGFLNDLRPKLSEDGEGGTYFLRDSHNSKVACFKPCDEEAGCVNNPRGRTSVEYATDQAIHCGIAPSEGHLREIAAYLFDCANGHFHDVPATMRVEIDANDATFANKKIGSLQSFISGEVIENFGVKNFAIRQVHKIGILDILLLNSDRNSGNVLVFVDEFGRYSLTPIDHGLSLPKCIEITTDSWVWLKWKQSKAPFDPYTIEYINRIDIDYNISLLSQELNLESIVFENMRISHLVLKKGTMRGLTLNEIGSIIARPDFDTKSILEELMLQAESLAIEKVRQNKHLINRIKLKTFKQKQQQQQAQNHIVHKFIEKGVQLKAPKLFQLQKVPKMKEMQIIKSKIKKLNTTNLTVNTQNNNIFSTSSLTPEPNNISIDDNKPNCDSIIKPFWTPNYKASSSSSSISAASTSASSKTQSPKQSKKVAALKKNQIPSLFLEKNNSKILQPQLIQKTSSIHDRDDHDDDEEEEEATTMTIFRSIESNNNNNNCDDICGCDTPHLIFSDFNIDSYKSNSVFLYDKAAAENEDDVDENGFVPLSRSTSCITSTSKSSAISSNFDIKSASLINHKSMMEKRREIMQNTKLNRSYATEHKIDDIDEEETAAAAAPEANNDNNNNPLAARSFSSISRTPVISATSGAINESPSSASHQSQDDMIHAAKIEKKSRFGIHPIMERMAKENYEVNKYFMYYLDQLLFFQCERISNRSRKSDKRDSIYDVDTVEGSFIWKNELRKHWIRSRLERKKLMQPKPPRNPFDKKRKLSNGHYQNKKKNVQNAKSTKTAQQQPHVQEKHVQEERVQSARIDDGDDDDDDDDDDEESESDDGHDWFGAEGTVDYDDDDDSAAYFSTRSQSDTATESESNSE